MGWISLKWGTGLKTEKVSLRLKFDAESEKVGPGIPISDLGAKKCQKRAKKRIFGPNMGEKNFKKGFYYFFHKIDLKLRIVIDLQLHTTFQQK